MLKKLLKNKNFKEAIKIALKKQEILDIILFGSVVTGKEKPKDIDLLVLFSPNAKDITETTYQLKKLIGKNIEITPKKYNEIFKADFFAREAILSQGYSFRQKKFISNSLGYENLILFKYSLKGMTNSKRIQFHYSMQGRGKEKGIIKKNKCYKFSDKIILSPIEKSEMLKEFFESWEIEYMQFPILIPKRIISILKYRQIP